MEWTIYIWIFSLPNNSLINASAYYSNIRILENIEYINSIYDNPLFIEGITNDYNLLGNSPCIDSGIDSLVIDENAFITTDYYGNMPDMGYFEYLEVLHISLMFYGVFAGSLAFFGNEFLERIFGYLGLIIGLPTTQPITQRKMTLLYFIKEFIFYTCFTLLPAFLGGLVGAYLNDVDLLSLAKFGFSLAFSFLMGLSFAYLIS